MKKQLLFLFLLSGLSYTLNNYAKEKAAQVENEIKIINKGMINLLNQIELCQQTRTKDICLDIPNQAAKLLFLDTTIKNINADGIYRKDRKIDKLDLTKKFSESTHIKVYNDYERLTITLKHALVQEKQSFFKSLRNTQPIFENEKHKMFCDFRNPKDIKINILDKEYYERNIEHNLGSKWGYS